MKIYAIAIKISIQFLITRLNGEKKVSKSQIIMKFLEKYQNKGIVNSDTIIVCDFQNTHREKN